MYDHCPRCDAALPIVDGEPAAFCANCGLPQLRVSEGAAAEPTARHGQQAETASRVIAGTADWPLLLRVAAAAAIVGAIPCSLLPGAVVSGGAGLLGLFLLPLLTIGAAAVYLRRRPLLRMSAALGSRMGAVIALLLTAAVTMTSAVAGFVLRYRYHSNIVEQNLDQVMQAQMRTIATTAGSDALIAAMRTPEWHAGMFLGLEVTVALLLLVAGTLFGALAGAMLAGRQRRNRATE